MLAGSPESAEALGRANGIAGLKQGDEGRGDSCLAGPYRPDPRGAWIQRMQMTREGLVCPSRSLSHTRCFSTARQVPLTTWT